MWVIDIRVHSTVCLLTLVMGSLPSRALNVLWSHTYVRSPLVASRLRLFLFSWFHGKFSVYYQGDSSERWTLSLNPALPPRPAPWIFNLSTQYNNVRGWEILHCLRRTGRKENTEIEDYLAGYRKRKWELVVGAEGWERKDKEEFHDLEPTIWNSCQPLLSRGFRATMSWKWILFNSFPTRPRFIIYKSYE